MKTNDSLCPPKISITIFIILFGGFAVGIALVLFYFHSSYKLALGEKPLPARPDFTSYQIVSEKKIAFFAYIGELADRENQQILNDRAELLSIYNSAVERGVLNRRQVEKIKKLVELYKVDAELSVKEKLYELVSRVNIIPRALVQVQAAIESGWGTSRFAVDGHNLFGQWCFKKGCGMVPSSRTPGKIHEVARFVSDAHSIRAYMSNLNTFHVYEGFRRARSKISEEDLPFSAGELASSLLKYSERGAAYVAEVQHMIQRENLETASNNKAL